MNLESRIPDLLALLELFDDVRVSRDSQQCREPVETRHNAILDFVLRHLARPADDRRYAEAALHDRSLVLGERGHSTVRPGKEFCAIVGREDDDRVVVLAYRL